MQTAPDKNVAEFYLREDLLQTRNVMLICIAFNIFLVFGDYVNFGFNAAFYEVVAVRAGFSLLSLVFIGGLRLVRTARQHDWVILVWTSFYFVLNWYVLITRPADNLNFTYINTLVVLAIYTVFPCSVLVKGIIAGVFTCGDLGIIVSFKSPVAPLALNSIAVAYLLANVLGCFVAARLVRFRQKNYEVFLQEYSLRKSLEKDAFTDHLTGAFTRRKFFQLGGIEFDRHREHERSFSAIMLDLDFFKNLNDEYGHAAGDHYLREIARVIAGNIRVNDVFGRLGGEEFALVLPDTGREDALGFAERLRLVCGQTEIIYNDQLLKTSISLGVAVADREDRAFQEVLLKADEALYQAKRQGRDQVKLWTGE